MAHTNSSFFEVIRIEMSPIEERRVHAEPHYTRQLIITMLIRDHKKGLNFQTEHEMTLFADNRSDLKIT